MGQSMRFGVLVCAGVVLSACMGPGGTSGDTVTRNAPPAPAPATALGAAQADAEGSVILETLMARESALPDGGAYDAVATAVLAANSRAAEAELRSARLRAQAAAKNWLPTLGPQISLTSLSDVIASLVVDQVLFDNGRKKAERAFARADVEVAAVTLAQDTNDRVFTALSLYLDAQKARERAALAARSEQDMAHFEWIMDQRVRGGVSNMSDLNVIRQKLAEIRADRQAQSEAAAAALAELNVMAIRPLDDVSGLSPLSPAMTGADPLPVLLAEAEKRRAVEAARIERAGFLPGASVGAVLGDNSSDPALSVASDKPLGFGTGASLKAVEAGKEAAGRKVSQAREDSGRRLRRLESEAGAQARQRDEAGKLAVAAKRNLDLFQSQYDAGQRQVMDVVGVYETYARQHEAELDLKYGAARAQLEIARELGLLADGGQI
ncbi:outer membrane protein, adhesin transport system [Lutimaribacter pacificus]|uniref:Outer membrane protein, adhesin transport system n=1 Tax=Lutimaribacter pacificus TaxID=391948 RepID=A0A1H0CZH7_9RHOB|nr:TolC family protein [Lutimaribacter pacificus]SDN63269.1 outer membrane protein, adhesin transport system [Lutimaribacter pacificus]SHJ38862.1 outer membrane protein, adhesin transport system [Lutimaribacter pacificus]